MNTAEKEFIQGLMIEYTNTEKQAKAAEAEKAFMESVTDLTKDVAKDVAKLMGNKKQVDTIAEANELVRYLNKNTDLKHSDRKYVENILIESGYEDLLIDRVAILERRMDANDTIDKNQRYDINKNTMVNRAQNVALELGQKRNDIQDVRIEDVEQRNRDQDVRIADVEQRNRVQNERIEDVEQRNRDQDVRIEDVEQSNRVQNARIVGVEQRNRDQDVRIENVEECNRNQQRAISDGVRHDIERDEEIWRGRSF